MVAEINLHRNKFPERERLKSRKQIEQLFQNGETVTEYPVQVIYYFDPDVAEKGTKVAFTVPKKLVKCAAQRNRIKRLMRESYRLNKHALLEIVSKNQGCMYIMFVYKSKEIEKYNKIEQKIIIILQRLKNNFK